MWTIRFALVPAAATLGAAVVFSALGYWQLDRAAQKRSLEAVYRERAVAAPLDLNAALAPCADGKADWRRVIAEGRWARGPQVLLDNAVLRGRVGYEVFTLLELAGAKRGVLVDRGWVPAPAYRSEAPDVALEAGETIVHGIAAPVPFSGLGAVPDPDASLGPRLLRVERIDLGVLGAALRTALLDCTIRLDPAAPAGYVREWRAPGLDPARHVAYAAQWFAFAAIAVGIYLLLHVERGPRTGTA
ncbi:MAG: SURF1 family protein [Gammaproteobacteria bacterium]|nr:SURF1 family protein [Gammaproteobacteria bacterium]